ncbi:hypothetical protein [Paenibacillus polymyxa]|uniref:hypothetical protein n=1 Tax=Paenibacillus polymyxa TaxID=1406 RepID=UPI00287F425E|nr:hypothetical protein [Paenibacillus polymyxa]
MIHTTKNKVWSFYITEIDQFGGSLVLTNDKLMRIEKLNFEIIEKNDKLSDESFAKEENIILEKETELPKYVINDVKGLINTHKKAAL